MSSQNPANRVLTIAKLWIRISRHGSVRLARLSGQVRAKADLERIRRLRAETEADLGPNPTSAAKYTDYDSWIPFNVARIGALSLHDSNPLRILDIGCGPGYFLAAARECGHDVYGVDAPETVLSDVERRVYSEMLAALSLSARVSPLLIERFVPMPLQGQKLDLITAFWICFNRHRQKDEWGVSEWQFFVKDALSHLCRGGMLHLELNAHSERYGALQWYDAETLNFFRLAGTVDRNIVRIRNE